MKPVIISEANYLLLKTLYVTEIKQQTELQQLIC